MVSSDFEVFYYQDRNFKTLSPHTHNYYEFYLFIEGDVTMEIYDSKGEPTLYNMQPGDLMLVPPGVAHHAIMHNSDKDYKRFVFWISKDCCNSLMQESVDYMYLIQRAEAFHKYIYHLIPASYHLIESKFLRLLEEITGDRYGSDAMRHLCMCDLVLTMNRTVYDDEHINSGSDEMALFQNILSYVETNLEDTLSLDDIASRFYVSKYYIAHLFKDTLGISLHQYIIKKRLAECRNAIVTGTSITEAYEKFGFRDYSSFYKAFRKEYGMSPKEYQTLSSLEITSFHDGEKR